MPNEANRAAEPNSHRRSLVLAHSGLMMSMSAFADGFVRGECRRRMNPLRRNPTENVWTVDFHPLWSDFMNKRTLPVLGAIALAAGMLALAQLSSRADDVKMVIPAAAAKSLMADDIKLVNDALKDGKDGKPPQPKDIKRAKMLTLDIALTAKAGKNEALYGQAVKVLEALKDDDLAKAVAAARPLAADLSNPKAEATTADAIKLVLWDADNKTWDKDLAMQLFKTARAGGLAYEKAIKDYAEKNPPAGELAKIAMMSNRIAMISQAIEQIGVGEKSPAEWKKFAEILRTTAVEVGDAATKKNAAAVKTGLGRMDTSCVNCHTKFKTAP
jgi:hypothetical protein